MSDLTRASINTISRPPAGPVRPPMPPGGMGQAPAPAGMTPKEIIGIIRRHILMIIISTILGFVIGGAGWFLCRQYIPIYTAVGYIRVDSPERKDPTVIATRMANKDTMYASRVTMASLMRQDSLYEELLQRDTIKKTDWYRNFKNKQFDGVKELKDEFRASPQRESSFISVSMRTHSADESTLIVEEMMDLFLKNQINISQDEIRSKLRNLRNQENLLKRDLKAANNALDELRESSGFTGLEQDDDFEHTFNRKEQQVVLELDNLEASLGELDEQIRTFEKRVQSVGIDVITQSQTEQDTIVLSLKQQEAQLKGLLEEKQTNLGESHRTIREIRERIVQTIIQREERYLEIAKINREALLSNAMDQKRAIESRQQTLFGQRKQAQQQLQALDAARSQYKILLSTRDQYKDSLESLTGQIDKFQTMIDDPETPKVRRAGRVRPPIEPSFPKWQVFFPGGLILGLMAGAGLAFLIELLNNKLRTPKDVSAHIRLPMLGMICHSLEDRDLKGISDVCRTIKEAPHSITSEFYRQLKTNLKKTLADTNNNKVILITSVAGGEGRTTVAANLTVSFIAENRNTIFVDANFRKPASLSIFPKTASDMPQGTQQVAGLSSYLTGECNISDIIRQCSMTKANVIDSGPLPANPAELLDSEKMTELLRQLSARYDYVVIDGPPLLVADAKVLATKADGCLLIFNATKTSKGAAQRAVRELKKIDANIFGCALVAVKAMKGGYFEEMFRNYRNYQKTPLTGARA